MFSRSYKKDKKTKYNRRNSSRYMRKKTRKIGGGNHNSVSNLHNTMAIGGYKLNTPLSYSRQSGGSKVCTESPYKFLQNGGKGVKRGKRHVRYNKKMSRRMKGGDGKFLGFAKFVNPFHPDEGGNILGLSNKGISPSGIGSPISTAANKTISPIQSWPSQKLILPHDYTKGGGQVGGGVRRNRKLKGGGIFQDVQNFGNSISYGFGSLVNGISGFSNQIYNQNPSPMVQFPRGLGNENYKEFQYSENNLKNIYDSAYAKSASM